ncbi:MAG TPA: ribosome silencing factor [Steroidobacteraceae bacterium]
MAVKRSSPPATKSSARTTHRKAPAKAAATRTPPKQAKAPAKTARKVAAPRVAARPAKAAKSRAQPTLAQVVLDALADMKAVDVKALDVRGITDITDTMVVASGTSDRHVKSIADRVVQRCKEAGFRPYGMEGERDGEWVLLDMQDVVLHVMLPRVREFYALEKLWEGGAPRRAS